MSTSREWLTRVATHPQDEDARRVGAEALEAEDAPRAEFIRAQVSLAGRRLDPARRRELKHRSNTLLQTHDAQWAGRLRALGASDFQFIQGFVQEVSLSETALATHGAKLFALEPVNRLRLVLSDGEGLAWAVNQPWFAQLRGLYLSGKGLAAAARALANASHPECLEFLVLSSAGVKAVEVLSQSEKLTSLRSLSLTGNADLGDKAAELLASTRLTLSRLYLTDTGLSDEGVGTLARAKPLQSLELLALNRNQITDEGVEQLAASKTLVKLRHLELAGNDELTEEGLLALRSAKALPALRVLLLRGLFYSARELAPLSKRFGKGLKL